MDAITSALLCHFYNHLSRGLARKFPPRKLSSNFEFEKLPHHAKSNAHRMCGNCIQSVNQLNRREKCSTLLDGSAFIVAR